MKKIVILSLSFVVSAALAEPVYRGSSFTEVLNIINDVDFKAKSQKEISEYGVYQEGKLPEYPVNSESVFSENGALEKDAKRTVNEQFDYYDRLEKRLHPNGVCVTGIWEIQNDNKYTGLFRNGTKALFLGRVSVAMGDTDFKDKRGFGIAGKIFPTIDTEAIVKTANFFTVDILMGESSKTLFSTKLTNEPEVGFDLSLIGLGLKISDALSTVDSNPGFRPLTPLSNFETKAEEVKTPRWIKLSFDKKTVSNNQKDFRNEVLVGIRENKLISLNIEVSDTTKDRNSKVGWTALGKITLTDAKVSYGCDRRLHFAHPKNN